VTAALLLSRAMPLVILAAAWEAVARAGLVSEYALPPLSNIAVTFAHLATGDLYYHTVRSVWRGLIAFAAAVPFGIAAGILIAWSLPVRILLNPILQCLYPMPKVALIPLTIIWLGIGDLSKIALIFIGSLVPIVMSAFNGARGVDQTLLWTARSLGASEGQLLREIVLPATLPEIMNGIRTALALSFILMVAAELVIANDGIGYLINLLGEAGQYSGMFAGVITISAIGFAADRACVALTRWLLAWRE
jgi:ABC-type nitrate/sulfonate/bicarbonate transport system permease component